MDKNKLIMPLAGLALVVSSVGGYVTAAHADTAVASATTSTTQPMQMDHQKPAAVGTVTAIDGDTLTLTDKKSGTSYTIDATNATIMKQSSTTGTNTSSSSSTDTQLSAPTTVSVSDIAVDDTLMVQGTTSGSTITATQIMDGQPPMGGPGGFGGGHGGPGVMGTVTAVNGTTLTITGKDGTTYTVNAGSATATKMETIDVSDIQVGDDVGIDGTVSGTSVTANHIMDGVPPQQNSTEVSSSAS